MINENIEDKAKDALDASKIALNHLSKEGIVVFPREIVSIHKRPPLWSVEIDGKIFAGVLMIDQKTGKVLTIDKSNKGS